MDGVLMRSFFAQVSQELATLDGRREALLTMLRGYEAFLQLPGDPPALPRSPSPIAEVAAPSMIRPRGRKAARQTMLGTISMVDAVRQVMEGSGGQPLTAQEVLDRAFALGADTKAKRPRNVVDLAITSLVKRFGLPIEKGGPRTWRWTGGKSPQGNE